MTKILENKGRNNISYEFNVKTVWVRLAKIKHCLTDTHYLDVIHFTKRNPSHIQTWELTSHFKDDSENLKSIQ